MSEILLWFIIMLIGHWCCQIISQSTKLYYHAALNLPGHDFIWYLFLFKVHISVSVLSASSDKRLYLGEIE